MQLSYSLLLLRRRHCMSVLKTWNSWVNCMLTLKVSSCLPRMLVLESRKSSCSISIFRSWETSTRLLSDSLKYSLRTKDLCSLKKLQIDLPNFINNSIKKRRSQLFQPRNLAQQKNKKYSLLWKQILKTKAKTLLSTLKLMRAFLEAYKCTLNLNSWIWVYHQEWKNLDKKSTRWLIDSFIEYIICFWCYILGANDTFKEI